MKVFLIIVGVILLLFYLRRRFNKSANPIKPVDLFDPIKTIQFEGFLGFLLGDEKDFVFSRINHLKLMNEEEAESHQLMMRYELNNLRSSVSTSNGLFDNIDSISFIFNADILCSIMIFIKAVKLDRSYLVDMLISKLTIILGDSAHTFNSVTTWENGPYIVSITNDPDDDKPYIYIGDRRLNRV